MDMSTSGYVPRRILSSACKRHFTYSTWTTSSECSVVPTDTDLVQNRLWWEVFKKNKWSMYRGSCLRLHGHGYSYSKPEDPILLLWRNLSNILYVDSACRWHLMVSADLTTWREKKKTWRGNQRDNSQEETSKLNMTWLYVVIKEKSWCGSHSCRAEVSKLTRL